MPPSTYSQTWDLDVLFPGGSGSPEFAAFMAETEALTASLLDELKRHAGEREASITASTPGSNPAPSPTFSPGSAPNAAATLAAELDAWTERLQTAHSRIRHADAFVGCLSAQNMADKGAVVWTEKVQAVAARCKQASDLFDVLLAGLPDETFAGWIAEPSRAGIAFPLAERREAVRDKLPPELEALASELAIDGYQGWGEHYSTLVGRIAIPWEENGETKKLSAGQAANRLESPKAEVREKMGALWEEAWAGQEDLCADTLNRLAGFRLKLYARRGWDDPLREPLKLNRMSRATLDAMWEAVAGGIEPLKRYLSAKAGLLGLEKLGWHDVHAPVGRSEAKIGYDEAASLIANAFAAFSPSMASLAKRAFEERWIEAEDRAGKRPGGFCTDFPLQRQTRIFMTYSGTPGNVSTLAHELGHAYHTSLVDGLAPFAQDYAMNVAETASTFAEGLVTDALLRQADGDEARLALLDERLQNAVAFFMNIRARFLFETRFYASRGEAMLDAARLGELMVEAQREAFGDALATWHPRFWASKLHFYLTDVPFYNFPYTFGYLFSTGLAAVAEAEGAAFADRYDSLLRDTGVMTVEELASRHLGVDLTKPDFWRAAVARAVSDADAFAELAKAARH